MDDFKKAILNLIDEYRAYEKKILTSPSAKLLVGSKEELLHGNMTSYLKDESVVTGTNAFEFGVIGRELTDSGVSDFCVIE